MGFSLAVFFAEADSQQAAEGAQGYRLDDELLHMTMSPIL